MASIKIIFRESIVEGKMGSCFIQIIHQRKIGILSTGIKLYAWEWDKVNNDVLWSEDNPKRQLIVQAARARLWQVVNELREIVDSMEINNMDYTARIVIEEYKRRLTKIRYFLLWVNVLKS